MIGSNVRVIDELLPPKKVIALILRIFFRNEANKFLLDEIYVSNNLNTIFIKYSPRLFIKVKRWWPFESQRLPTSIILFYIFISIFILLPRRKQSEALYIGQVITPTFFQRCQGIAVWLKLFYFYFYFLIFLRRCD